MYEHRCAGPRYTSTGTEVRSCFGCSQVTGGEVPRPCQRLSVARAGVPDETWVELCIDHAPYKSLTEHDGAPGAQIVQEAFEGSHPLRVKVLVVMCTIQKLELEHGDPMVRAFEYKSYEVASDRT